MGRRAEKEGVKMEDERSDGMEEGEEEVKGGREGKESKMTSKRRSGDGKENGRRRR